MRNVLLLFLIPFVLVANEPINECVTDIYFANGILNEKEDAKASLKLIINEANILKHHNMTV